MSKEMIIQRPAFNTDYFVIGQAVRVYNNVKKDAFDGLIICQEKNRIGIVKVEWYSPMTGVPRHEPKTEYLYVEDMIKDIYTIERL
jgi:hypothetical protein